MSSEFVEPGSEGERVVARLRPHARALLFPALLLIVGSGALAYFSNFFAEDWQNLAVTVGGTVLLLLIFFVPLFRWLSRRYVVTSRRIIMRHGTFTRSRQELLHSRGYDVTVRKGALQSMFGSGDVLINTGLDHPVVLRDVPHADLVQSTLHDLMEKGMNPIAARRQAEASHPDETKAWGRR
ncbi:membrane protein YdbS with pleckstrin-like domain [Homoserinimonas aerilata]|uniref:Membrane protein YdbS with pleckstrin-like domain n=1 Tax=Homoserinimonas aerilata TaxID=1162970 RepID=A0A542YKQ1_9MICO|nr:PH domain-containing protein [Homoserinimonas aerilata]TQL48670.1 membrane protein YdbS with pleckstrin-like domain [Homoserinimonas aerilata]